MADLEQRVKRLEGELKILKNQIQMTLLDLQAELAAHYYPELRSDVPQPRRAPQAQQHVQQQAQAPVQFASEPVAPPAAAVSKENATQVDADPSEPIRLKKVSLDEIHERGVVPRAAAVAAEANRVDRLAAVACQELDPVEQQKQEEAIASLAEPITSNAVKADVMRWAGDTVAVLGKEQTRKVIALCQQDGRIDERMQGQLESMLSLGSDWEPEQRPSFDAVLTAMMELVEILESH